MILSFRTDAEYVNINPCDFDGEKLKSFFEKKDERLKVVPGKKAADQVVLNTLNYLESTNSCEVFSVTYYTKDNMHYWYVFYRFGGWRTKR